MHVLSNFRAISAVLLILGLSACSERSKIVEPDLSYDSLSEAISKIEVNSASLADLPGETQAEKLLYQAGIVAQMQTAMLVMFDTQAKTARMSGNSEFADELVKSRDVMMEAVNLEMETMIKDAGKLYETHLEADDIERLIVLHSDPAMQKLIQSQPEISQGMLPIGQTFGLRVGARYQELINEKAVE